MRAALAAGLLLASAANGADPDGWQLRYRVTELSGQFDPADADALFAGEAPSRAEPEATMPAPAPADAAPSAGGQGGTLQQRFVVQHSEPRDEPFVRRVERELVIRLAGDRVAIRDGAGEVVRDYASRRAYRVAHDRERVRDESLYADAGGAWSPEFDEVAGIDALVRVIVWSGSLIDVSARGDSDDLSWLKRVLLPTVAEEDGQIVLRLRGVEFARATPSGHELGPDHRDDLRRALAHVTSASVAEPLAERGVVPSRLDYSTGEGGEWSGMMRLELAGIEPLESPIEVPEWGADRDLRDWFDRAVREASLVAPGPPPPIDAASAELAGPRPLQGLFRLFDHVLTTGGSPQLDTALVGAALADGEFRDLVTAMRRGPSDGIEAVKAIDRDALPNAHVLDVLLADAYASRDDRGTSIQLLLRALYENPRMAVAWLQLAAHYAREGYPVKSWTCADTARRLAGDDSAIADRVAALEARIVELRPAYF